MLSRSLNAGTTIVSSTAGLEYALTGRGARLTNRSVTEMVEAIGETHRFEQLGYHSAAGFSGGNGPEQAENQGIPHGSPMIQRLLSASDSSRFFPRCTILRDRKSVV